MKKQLLVLLMLGAFVGQVQAAEGNESNTTVEVNLSKNGRGQIDGGTIDLYSVKNGEKKSEKGFPKAILEGQAGIAGRWKGDFPLVEDRLTIIKSWFPGDRELQKVNKLEIVEKQKEEEAQRLARVKTEKEAEALRKQQEKAEKLAAEKAEKERIEKEREEAAAAKREQERLAEEQRVAAELARKRAFEEAERIRIALEFQQAEELRLAEEKAELARLAELQRLEQERLAQLKIAELERIQALEQARIAELKIAQEREQVRLAEIERAEVEEKNKLQQIEDEKRAQEVARTQKIAIEQARLAQVTGREYPGRFATCTNCRGKILGASKGSNTHCDAFYRDPEGRVALVTQESLNGGGYSSMYLPEELLPLTLLEVRNLIAQAYSLTKVASLPDDEYSPLFEKFYNTARGAYENPFVKGKFLHPDQYKENPWAHNLIALITELKERIPNAFNAFGDTILTEINSYFKGENKSRQNNLVRDGYGYSYSAGSKFHDYENALIQSSAWIDAVKEVLAQPEASAADEEIDFAALLGDGAADDDASGIDFAALLGDGSSES